MIHVGYTGFDEIIEAARHHVAFQNVWIVAREGREGLKDFRRGAVQFDLDEDQHGAVEHLGRKPRRIAENIPFAGQSLDAFGGCRLREIYAIGQFGIGQAPILLKGAQNTPVHRIEILHQLSPMAVYV